MNSIVGKTSENFGLIERISFSFERHGVFVHKGVGRGYKMNGGFVLRTAKGPRQKAREGVDWFNPIMEQNVPDLADRLAEKFADISLKATRMNIK